MALTLDQQTQYAETSSDFRGRVEAACYTAAVTVYGTSPTDPSVKRLISDIVKGGTPQVTSAFSWWCISRPALNNPLTDITDTFLINTCSDVPTFTAIAQQLYT